MKKHLRLIAALAAACCMLLACALPSAAESSEDYYYSISVTTNLGGDAPSQAIIARYSVHGYLVGGSSESLFRCDSSGNPIDYSHSVIQPGERTASDVFFFSYPEPLLGVRLLAEPFVGTGTERDDHDYYLPLDLSAQQPGIENAIAIGEMYLIEGFAPGGAMILSPEAMAPVYTPVYDALPVFSGPDPDSVYCTTQVLTVSDSTLASVTLDGEPVPFEGNTATVTLPGNIDALYHIAAQDANGNLSQMYIEMVPLGVLMNPVALLTLDNVKPNHEQAIEDVIANVLALMDAPHNTAAETDVLRDMEAELRALLARINEAEACRNSESILATRHITAENVTPADREALLAARADLERALRDYSGNYLPDVLETIRSDLARVNAALAALEENLADLPQTGDGSRMALWLMLLAAGSAGAFLSRKKNRAAE